MNKWFSFSKSSLLALYMTLGGLIGVSPAALAGGEVNLLTWEGYADDSFVSIFEEQSGCKLTKTYVGSNDEMSQKWQQVIVITMSFHPRSTLVK